MLAQVTAISVKFRDAANLRFPLTMLIIQGLVGRKPMAKAAGDGQAVGIFRYLLIFQWVTEAGMLSALDLRYWRQEYRQANPPVAFNGNSKRR